MKKAVCIAFLWIFGLHLAHAQKYPFRTFSIEQGLSESVVYDLVQDDEGYIWLATGYGLNRFDGLRFQKYFEEHGLNSSRIRSLLKDSDGRIWIGSERGVNYWQADSIYAVPELNALQFTTVISIFEDKTGSLWFGTDGNGVWQYSTGNSKVITQYSTSNGLINNRVLDIAERASGSLWFGTQEGITVLQNGNFITFREIDNQPIENINSLEADALGNMWIGSKIGLIKYDGEQLQLLTTKDGLVHNHIQTLTVTQNNNLWIGTEDGVSFYDGKTFENYTVESGLSTKMMYSSMMDLEGNMWFGTYAGGVNLFLGSYFANYDAAMGLPNNLVTSFTEDAQDRFWISTYGGGITSLQNGSFTDYGLNSRLPDNQIYTLFTDSKKRTWIGMREGLARMKDGRVRVFSKKEFPYLRVRNVMETAAGTFWIATYDDGIIKYDGQNFEQISTENGLINNRVLHSVEGEDGSIWIATYGGITRYKNGELQSFAIQEGLPNNAVMNLLKDDKGRIWASTFGGLAWFDGLRFQNITPDDGLPDRVCYFIHQNKDGLYWVGTTKGVVRFDAEAYFNSDSSQREPAFQILNKEQGLIANELNLGAVYEDSDGALWFGTVEGLSRFNPEEYLGNQVPPKVHIVGVHVSGKELSINNELVLSYSDNTIEFEYAGINFEAPNQIVYEYRLKGIDEGWQQTSARSVKYPSLLPGDYTFQVHARSMNGSWSSDIKKVKFTITAPFWMQWWFWLLFMVAVVGIIVLFYNYYRARKMIDIERMRVRIASDLHDDVGASLTEIALQSDFLQAGDIDSEIKGSLKQIGKQCRKIVSSLDDIVWSIDARNDTLGDLTDRMQDYAIHTLEPKNMRVNYEFENLNMENKLPVAVKENIYLIFKEAVNNISKYSNGDRVDIVLENKNSSFYFRITDNGTTGKGTKKTGHGLRNMDMRAKRIGADITINTTDGFTIEVEGSLKAN